MHINCVLMVRRKEKPRIINYILVCRSHIATRKFTSISTYYADVSSSLFTGGKIPLPDNDLLKHIQPTDGVNKSFLYFGSPLFSASWCLKLVYNPEHVHVSTVIMTKKSNMS